MAQRAHGAGDARLVAAGILRRGWFWWVLFALWWGTLCWLSSRVGSGEPQRIPHLDKVLHFSYFGLGGIILQCAVLAGGKRLTLAGMLALGLLVACVVGVLDEYHQTFTPGRSGNDPWDLLADVLGGAAAALLVAKLKFSIAPKS